MLTNGINSVLDYHLSTNEDSKQNVISPSLTSNSLESNSLSNKQQSNSPSSQNSFSYSLSTSPSSQNQVKDSSELNSSFVIKNNVKAGQLFGPFQDLIPWLAIQNSKNKHNLPKELYSLNPDLLALFLDVKIANNEEEQNMEIILKNNKFYFRAMQTIDFFANKADMNENRKQKNEVLNQDQDLCKNNETLKYNSLNESNKSSEIVKSKQLFAWFSLELNSRLPSPSVSVLNGTKRFFCARCNQMFIHQNLAILHIIYECSVSDELSSNKINVNQSKIINSLSSKSSFNNNQKNNLFKNKSLKTQLSVNTSLPSSVNSNIFSLSCLNLSNSNKPQLSCNSNSFSKSNKDKTNSIKNNLSNIPTCNSSIVSNVPILNKSNKSVKKRAFDIDSLVVNSDCNSNQANHVVDQINQINNTSKKNKVDHTIDYKLNKNQNKSESNKNCTFKTPTSISSTSKLSETNSTLINSLNSPFVNTLNSANRFNMPLFNPFSLLDPNLTNTLSNPFPKLESTSLASPLVDTSSLRNNNNTLNNDSLNLNNATTMFNPSFTNPFDFATIYAQHQQNLLQSMFPTTHTNNLNIPVTSNNNALNSNSAQNYFQNQLLNANTLFASQNLANLSTLNNFNDLTSLLNSANSVQTNSGLSSLASNLSPSLANSLFTNLPVTATANTNSLNHQTQLTNQLVNNFYRSNPTSNDTFNNLSPTNTNEKLNSKKKKQKEKDLNTLTSKSNFNNQSNITNLLNNSNNILNKNNQNNVPILNDLKLNSSIHPYLQYLPPSLAALSFPQSNWCAKCNISFRMTSDLVYHMRSQHKESNCSNGDSPVLNPNSKKKREENKLICHICKEGFKERHHLTRHMTSHN